MIKVCIQCGKEFELTDSELEFFVNRNLEPPKRCAECRARNKKNRRRRGGRKHSNVEGTMEKMRVGGEKENSADSVSALKSVPAPEKPVKSSEGKPETGAAAAAAAAETASAKNEGPGKLLTIIIAIAAILVLIFGGGHLKDIFAAVRGVSAAETDGTMLSQEQDPEILFRSDAQLAEHYEKHGMNMGFRTAEDYAAAAAAVIANPRVLHKNSAETIDGNDIYYVEDTNELVVMSTDGYIRTYFEPTAGMSYYNRQ